MRFAQDNQMSAKTPARLVAASHNDDLRSVDLSLVLHAATYAQLGMMQAVGVETAKPPQLLAYHDAQAYVESAHR
jgi:hypothetical protein